MIENGKTVQVHYKGTLADGTVFDSSEGSEPLEFVTGEQSVIPGFEAAVVAMAVGETRTVTIPCDEAYGDILEDMIGLVPRESLPEDLEPEIGMMLEMHTENGVLPVRIVEVADDTVTLDANHPLAGEDLTFELTLVAIA
ncbi:MAG TPA: peptidylprolyl isomerase [Candidatus Krumholzibacteria bacterium]|nr:peptidylprolyl isomerase [Candidatus Krumholzibacteria bacterium]